MNIMEILANLANQFAGLFKAGGETFLGLLGGILPSMIVLLTGVNALIILIGPEKVERLGEKWGKKGILYYPLRYALLPFIAVFFFTNPMAYTMGRFLNEEHKIGFIDSALSAMHFPLGIFPHINPGEIFTWAGIAAGFIAKGYSLGDLAVRYLLTGFLVILIRGTLTEKIYLIIHRRQQQEVVQQEVVLEAK